VAEQVAGDSLDGPTLRLYSTHATTTGPSHQRAHDMWSTRTYER